METLTETNDKVTYTIELLICLIMFSVFVTLPLYSTKYIMGLITISLISSICAMSYNLLLGYAGLLSFGHIVGWGVGAYTVGILAGKGITVNFFLIIGVTIFVTIIISAVFAFLALRTQGIYFALITLALAELCHAVTLKWSRFTGGENGLTGIDRPWLVGDKAFYYLVLISFIISFLLIRSIISSWFGKTLVGIRENDFRMGMLGYNTWIFKYLAYIISAIFASIAGLLSCFYIGIASPADFNFVTSGSFLLMVLIGGRATLIGPIIGSFFVVFATHYLSAYTNEWMLILGVIFVLVVMFARKGIGGYLLVWKNKIQQELHKQ